MYYLKNGIWYKTRNATFKFKPYSMTFSLKYTILDICKESLETASNEVMPNCIVLTKPLTS